MIAITDPSAFEVETQPLTAKLTTELIDEYITGSVVINTTITLAVKNLLKSIITNTSTLQINSTITKLASYAGFSVNSQGVVSFNSSNISLDKLTFYTIFRLPFASSVLQYQNPLPISNSLPIGTVRGWGKFANYIRSISGSGLKMINDAGEQVNGQHNLINDQNEILDGWWTEKAYNFLGEHPFNTTPVVPSGLYPVATEKAMLFGQNTNVPNASGEEPLEFTKIPLYFYLLAKVENPYNSTFWLNTNKDSITISRVPHWPARLQNKILRKHLVKPLNDSLTVPNGTYPLSNDNNGTFFTFKVEEQTTIQKAYINALDSQSISFEGLLLSKANNIIKNNNGFVAIWNDFVDFPLLTNNSGLTLGMGVDIGAGFNGLFKIKMTITISGGGTFKICYGGNKSSALNSNINIATLKSSLCSLMNIESSKCTVTKKETTDPFSITITRSNDSKDIAYNHRIYITELTGSVAVQITPNNESDRWKEQTLADKNDSYFYLNQLLNYSFSNIPVGEDYWLNQLGTLTSDEKSKLKLLLKKSLGCRSRSGYHLWLENKALLKKIEIKSYVQNLRATFHKFFLDRYYYKTKEGSGFKNGLNTTIQHLLENPSLKTKPNQAELFALVLLNYNFPGLYVKRFNSLIEAINNHSLARIKTCLKGLSKDRLDAFDAFAGPTVKNKLYHGIID